MVNHTARTRRSDDFSDVNALFVQLAECDPGTERYRRQRAHIVERCLPLADHVAGRYARRGELRDDLVQVARVGLMNAVNRFDVDAGYEFVCYAVPTIMGEVRRHFRDHGWAIRVPRPMQELHLRIGKATAELYQSLGHAPNATELAQHLGMDRQHVVEGLVAGSSYRCMSIDQRRGDDEDSPTIADHLGTDDARLDQIEKCEALRPLIAALPDEYREMLRLRFFDSQTQSQIAERMGISQMQVSRLLTKTLAGLHNELVST